MRACRLVSILLVGWMLSGCVAGQHKAISSTPGDAAVSEPVDLFEVHQGTAAQYGSVRIPSLATAADGTILCWVVGRQTASDWAAMDLLLSRSHDGGRNWSKPEVFIRGDGHVVDNATAIVADGRQDDSLSLSARLRPSAASRKP